jgi:alpha-beta hydrolase superfamily lysophospholipase
MALSGRPEIEFTTPQEWMEFFCQSLNFVVEFYQIKKLYILGHSLGGCVASYFAIKNK